MTSVKKYLGATLIALAASATGVLATPGAAHAAPAKYEVLNKSFYSGVSNPGGAVASCFNPNATCTLTVTLSKSTTITTSFGYTGEGIASQLGFQFNRTVSAAAACTSPKLRSNQQYVAYRLGRQARYKIRRTTYSRNRIVVKTSGWLYAWEPYTGAQIRCYVVNR
ncbi:hypothetical protein Val02_92300 [Virgisporangium aliadipatigenens]|uniref:Uncharacterized protein n=1 Tax=Virgisporangium aliadipatigenens TaxID=741659 RepID=A0A8J4DVZ7_9ACTN|nr:hypothetical protein [Virgisporangium aliadipatigenens]GIJ52344.1 hypothetical protein Val02_92300 [Virgisporangium aliadipatigenens]